DLTAHTAEHGARPDRPASRAEVGANHEWAKANRVGGRGADDRAKVGTLPVLVAHVAEADLQLDAARRVADRTRKAQPSTPGEINLEHTGRREIVDQPERSVAHERAEPEGEARSGQVAGLAVTQLRRQADQLGFAGGAAEEIVAPPREAELPASRP